MTTSTSGLLTDTVEVESPGVATLSPPPTGDAASWAVYYEQLYRGAAGQHDLVPWHDGRPNPALVSWLSTEGQSLVRPGATVVVVGSGLGDDAAELVCRGYDVTAFDISPTAVEWSCRAHPEIAEKAMVADLLALPQRMQRRYDLVVEIFTIQAMHPSLRERAAAAIASLMRPRGTALVICRGRDAAEPVEKFARPPYPLCKEELAALMGAHGLTASTGIDDFMDEQTPPVRRLRGAFRRA